MIEEEEKLCCHLEQIQSEYWKKKKKARCKSMCHNIFLPFALFGAIYVIKMVHWCTEEIEGQAPVIASDRRITICEELAKT